MFVTGAFLGDWAKWNDLSQDQRDKGFTYRLARLLNSFFGLFGKAASHPSVSTIQKTLRPVLSILIGAFAAALVKALLPYFLPSLAS
jgi:hypothetical protein